MLQLKTYLAPATLLLGGLLLGSCGGNNGRDTTTTTPTSTLGTDSAATKVGGTAPDTAGIGTLPASAAPSQSQ